LICVGVSVGVSVGGVSVPLRCLYKAESLWLVVILFINHIIGLRKN